MKKLVMSIGLVAIIACLLFSCESGCANGHTWGATAKIVKEATCVEAGTAVYTCTICGATKQEVIQALEHDFNDSGKCTRCANSKADIEAAEARIGLKYYSKFEDAVHAAVVATEEVQKTVEVLKDSVKLTQHSPKVNGSVTINANGADFGHGDISIYTYEINEFAAVSGEATIIINNAKNLYVWGEPDNLKSDSTTINITLNGCTNEGSSKVENQGRLIYLTGTKGITNVTLNNCSVSKTDSPVYTNASGDISIIDCTFTDCAVPINMNYKATAGTRKITISGCTFTRCGCSSEESLDLAGYAAPIRIVHSKEGAEDNLIVKNTVITDTIGSNGDILIGEGRSNYSSNYPISVTIQGTKGELQKQYTDDTPIEKVSLDGSDVSFTYEGNIKE